MSMEAIVYTSNTGHTAAYARLLGEKTGLAVLTLDEAIRTLEKGKTVISMLYKGLSDKKDRTEQDERMLELLSHDASYVSEENLKEVLKWYDEAQIGGTCEKI